MGRRAQMITAPLLLGIISGFWDYPNVRAHAGLAVVTATDRILELLTRDDVVKERHTLRKEHRQPPARPASAARANRRPT